MSIDDKPIPPDKRAAFAKILRDGAGRAYNTENDALGEAALAGAAALAALDAADARATVAERERDALKLVVPRKPFDVRCADALADEVQVLIRRRLLDARSPAADALLDYRNPPMTPRSDRLADVERDRDAARADVERLTREAGLHGEALTIEVDAHAVTSAANAALRAECERLRTALDGLTARIHSDPDMSGHLVHIRIQPDHGDSHKTSDALRVALAATMPLATPAHDKETT